MKNLLILGAGTAGTMMANHLSKKLPTNEWQITIVDKEKAHYYQPGYLFVPFDIYQPEQIVKSIDQFIPKGVKLVREPIDRIAKDEDQVYLANGEVLAYDLLIVATGTDIAPQEIEGMLGEHWQESVFDFYTFAKICSRFSF